jgi:hypothetical protein
MGNEEGWGEILLLFATDSPQILPKCLSTSSSPNFNITEFQQLRTSIQSTHQCCAIILIYKEPLVSALKTFQRQRTISSRSLKKIRIKELLVPIISKP